MARGEGRVNTGCCPLYSPFAIRYSPFSRTLHGVVFAILCPRPTDALEASSEWRIVGEKGVSCRLLFAIRYSPLGSSAYFFTVLAWGFAGAGGFLVAGLALALSTAV